ncbi:MAG: hypothetical protein EP330_28585 [Deltaproteobacteria bacterium]|nr:MAG: hypothetical protein EP330_28585 [Deltaproteobacteria bacterium]
MRFLTFSLLALAACTPEPAPLAVDDDAPAICGDALRVGMDANPITPFCGGEALVVGGVPGAYSVWLGFEFEDDASEGVLLVMRMSVEDGPTEDVFARLPAFEDGGVWETNTAFPLSAQTEEELLAWDGATVQLSVAATIGDTTYEMVYDDMVLEVP